MKSNVLSPSNLSVTRSVTEHAVHVKHGGGECVGSVPVLATGSDGRAPATILFLSSSSYPKASLCLESECGAGAQQQLHKATLNFWVSRSCCIEP